MNQTVIKQLRALVPPRPLTWQEAKTIAERQATILLELLGQREPAVNVSLLAELPRIKVAVEQLGGISGFSQWSKGRWLVVINKNDSRTRRRFTLGHEFKHVLDNPFIKDMYSKLGKSMEERHRIIERICDYFAACLLMPRNWVKQQWANGIQNTMALAAIFNVSEAAMDRRLRDLHLIEDVDRHTVSFASLSQPVSAYLRKPPMRQHERYCPAI
jgi:Zn-dependent peptidase ImmA (M78 family)